MGKLEDKLKELEDKYGKLFEIDPEHQLIKKEGWKVTQDLFKLGQDTVAQKIADAEGITLEKAKMKLKDAKDKMELA